MVKILKKTISMLTRDGIRLDADVYRPDSAEALPILLMRQPYSRQIASTVVYAHPVWYASQGYIVIIQDVRGRGTSQGEFKLFSHEIEDGIDTINWASQLTGSTGEIGMYGFSYQGMTQLYAAVGASAALKVICPAMIGYDLYSDWAYENGAFCLQANLGWAIQLAAETARLQGNQVAFQKLYEASHNLPLYDSTPVNPSLLQQLDPDSFYHDWLNHPTFDSYWQQLSPKCLLNNIDLPMLHIGGWFDPYLRGTLNLHKAMTAKSRYPQPLIVGPWAHLPWGRKVGVKDYGNQAVSSIDHFQIAWFDYLLKGKKTHGLKQPPVCLFEMGSNQWRYFKSFPKNTQVSFYLASEGLANLREDSGQLLNSPSNLLAEDIIVHDSWRPVPALGGHASIPAGSFERSHLDCRTDILTYTSEILTQNLSIAGEVLVEVYAIADTPTFDLSAILSEVYPDGSVYNFTQGYIRISSPQLPIQIPLQATCIKISQGNCLRLSLSAACFPAYPINTGTGKLPKDEQLIEAKIITLQVLSGNDYPSKIILSATLNVESNTDSRGYL